jgi:hypothetical protein
MEIPERLFLAVVFRFLFFVVVSFDLEANSRSSRCRQVIGWSSSSESGGGLFFLNFNIQ